MLTVSTRKRYAYVDGDNMKTWMQAYLKKLWNASPPLTATAIAMLVALLLSLIGMVLDPRMITGMPAWLKPAKFAVSIAIYSITFAWIFTFLPQWPRLRSVVGWITALVFVIEIAIIDAQAVRGTTSHFNVGTPLDAMLFSVMGIAILLAWMASVALAVALFRHKFADTSLGWALRLGMLVTVLGSATGGLMTGPTRAQLEGAKVEQRLKLAGAHTVGAPDGGPGLSGTGWSREHGDLRIPHFLGLHAMQAIPLLAFLIRRVRPAGQRSQLVVVGSVSYFSLFVILLAQALRGQSVIAPDSATLVLLATWSGLTALAIFSVLLNLRGQRAAAGSFLVSCK